MLLSRWRYYLASIPTLLLRIKNWPAMLVLFLGLPVATPLIIELRGTGARFRVRSKMDVWIIKETCLDRDYERHGTPLQNGWTILDIGAALGDFAICAALRHPASHIYAYEPSPESYALLGENLALNGVQNVMTFQQAVGAQAGPMHLSMAAGAAVKYSTASSANTAGGTDAVDVAGVTLDDVFASLQLATCDFLKMDCEGGEYDILMHASPKTLGKIRHICLEYHEGVTPHTHQELAAFLREHGFVVTTTPNPAHHEIGFLYARRT
ncbi:MAG: FkbM family methyltransferase [Anaerolineae bacterium]|nr:FkbM family methyltransferase [Anaerolineae bacterium]